MCESGIFMDCVGWTYQQNYRIGEYVLESGRSDGDSENIITVFLCVKENVNVEDIERTLKIEEE